MMRDKSISWFKSYLGWFKSHLEKIYTWIDKHLEMILWLSFAIFCLLLIWIVLEFFLCFSPDSSKCEFKSWLNFLTSVVGVLGGGFLSVMGALFHHGITIRDANTKKYIENLFRDKVSEQCENVLNSLDQLKTSHSSSDVTPENTSVTQHDYDVCVDSPAESSCSERVVNCLKKSGIKIIPHIEENDIDLSSLLEKRVKLKPVVILILGIEQEFVNWIVNIVKYYIKIKNKDGFSCFPRILISHNNLSFNEDFLEICKEHKVILELKEYDFGDLCEGGECKHQLIRDIKEIIKESRQV